MSMRHLLVSVALFSSALATALPAGARELTADRPDKTESPYTVDEGRFQFETDFAHYVQNEASTELLLAYVNAKYGLNRDTDVQAIFSPARRLKLKGQEATWGISDLTLRAKHTFWEDAEKGRALGLIAYTTLPTSRRGETAADRNRVTGGASVPFAFGVGSFDVGTMAQFDFGETKDLGTMVTVGHDIVGELAGYTEFYNVLTNYGTQDWQATADFGLTYNLSEDLQVDANAHFGLTEASDKLQLFSGFTWRK